MKNREPRKQGPLIVETAAGPRGLTAADDGAPTWPTARRSVRGGLVLVILFFAAGPPGCTDADKQRWNEFWGLQDGGGIGLWGRGGDHEPWTIECNEYRGEKRREFADQMADSLRKRPELKPELVRVEHDAECSRVFYGEYRLRYVKSKDAGTSGAPGDMTIQLSPEIKRDLDFIRRLALGDRFPFFSARPIPRPADSQGPPEWDLRNARGVYTLHVGVTYRTPELPNYIEAAIQWVRALREDGHEAYYYHDPERGKADICVGTFGEDAMTLDKDGKQVYSEAVQRLRNQREEFLYNLENGRKVQRIGVDERGRKVRMPNWSFLVRIPRKEDAPSMLGGQASAPGRAQP